MEKVYFMALEKACKNSEFFLLLFGHPVLDVFLKNSSCALVMHGVAPIE